MYLLFSNNIFVSKNYFGFEIIHEFNFEFFENICFFTVLIIAKSACALFRGISL